MRVISPARSLAIISSSVRSVAQRRLEEMGLRVSFSRHCEERDIFDSSSTVSRLEDIHEAFSDQNVKGILTSIGGFNSIDLLDSLDYEIIASNPKILCGYSDITTLQNAIFAKTGLITYSGPHFSTFGCLHGIDYVIDYFRRSLLDHAAAEGEKRIFDSRRQANLLEASGYWSDDEWFMNQEDRHFMSNEGYIVLQPGMAAGHIVGGNIGAFSVLQGTDYMPSLQGAILFLEDNYPIDASLLNRHLQSLILQPGFEGVRGVVLGRFQVESDIRIEGLREIIDSKPELANKPIIAGADFGHTLPLFTFPIGGQVRIKAHSSGVELNCPTSCGTFS